jgi:hypothetical protein
MILEALKSLVNHPGIAYAKAAVKKRVRFKDLPETHQKAIMVYMLNGAWGLDPNDPADVEKAIKLYGNKPFFMGELAIDDELKKAIMSSNDFGHDTFDNWTKWYAKQDTEDFKANYNEDWPVILNEPSLVPKWGLFKDGWHRFNYHYLGKNKKKVPFIQYISGIKYWSESRLQESSFIKVAKRQRTFNELYALTESAFFSKQNPVNTSGRVVPRKLTGIVYHGSSTYDINGWFDTLEVDDEAAAVWVTPEEAIARRFGLGKFGARLVFVNKYRLNGIKAAELDQKAYDRISSRKDFNSDDMDMRYALAEYLSNKGYSAWLTTGSISGKTYEDIAIFSGSESEAEYEGTSFLLKDGSWSEYEYFYNEDKVQEYLKKNGMLQK